ncbi:MAG: hypothetical protein FWB91_10055 [Defluviitaleaceae bacterium]|nr:hypothetical protein [Defluviitaleaceae bacterium]
MAVFVADKLAWDQGYEAPFYSAVSEALKQSLEAASLVYMEYMVENKMLLSPHKWWKEAVVWLKTK